MNEQIKIQINGQPQQVADNQLQTLIENIMAKQNLKAGQFVVAVNEKLVPATHYAETQLIDGDRIEFLSAMVGG